MTKLSAFLSRSILRRRKGNSKNKTSKKTQAVEVLEDTESDATLNDSSSCSLECVAPPKEEVRGEVEPNPKPKPKKNVSFCEVSVRRYAICLGDNPNCKFPLSLDWKYGSEDKVLVDQYEEQRALIREQTFKDRIHPRLYVPPSSTGEAADHYLRHVHMEQDYDDQIYGELTLYERRARLREWYTEASLRAAERRRIVALALQWRGGGDAPPFPFSQQFVTRYTK